MLTDLVHRWLASQLLHKIAGDAVKLLQGLVHMNRYANGARLVGDSPRNGLPDPPVSVGRKLVPTTVFKFLHCAHQADISLLDQIEELKSSVGVLASDRYDQSEVGYDHFLARPFGHDFAPTNLLNRGGDLGMRRLETLLERFDFATILLDPASLQRPKLLDRLFLQRLCSATD